MAPAWRFGFGFRSFGADRLRARDSAEECRPENLHARRVCLSPYLARSKYGFTDILENNRVVLDPSRIAAQIASGIGFIGGGVIFVPERHRPWPDTTAATVWLTSAVGMACGAGPPILAITVTAGNFVVS
jgi:putative Mg2+ transporter-C (MgtC) family protein